MKKNFFCRCYISISISIIIYIIIYIGGFLGVIMGFSWGYYGVFLGLLWGFVGVFVGFFGLYQKPPPLIVEIRRLRKAVRLIIMGTISTESTHVSEIL